MDGDASKSCSRWMDRGIFCVMGDNEIEVGIAFGFAQQSSHAGKTCELIVH